MLRRVSSATFVGRADELAALEGALASTPAFAFVAGESGVGKSRLTAEFERRAEALGARVLVGHCLELGGTVFPYAPLVDALRPVARELAESGSDVADTLPAETRDALAALLPQFARPGGADAGAGDEPIPQPQLFEALLALIERLGRVQPIVLVLEDLHWADQSTRDFLTFLVRSARTESLCLVATYRSDELHRRHPLRPVLAELERVPGVQRIGLEPFSRDEVGEQLAGILDAPAPDELTARLYARGDGNPLYTEELLAAARDGCEDLPGTLRDALLARFERLAPAAQEVVRVAAVVDRPMRHAVLRAVSDMSADELLDGAREAVAHQVLVTQRDGTYSFRHALVGEAVYEDLLPGERTAMHAAFAAAIERDPALLGDAPAATVAAELACHWRAAHDMPRALAAAVAAGDAATRVFAYGEAGRHFERALEVWERVPDAPERAGLTRTQLLRRAAAVATNTFEEGRAVALQREAVASLDERADPLEAARANAELGRYLRNAGEHDESDRVFRRALALLPADAELERTRLRERMAASLMLRGHLREGIAEASAAAEAARRLGANDVQAHAMSTEGIARATLGETDEGARLLREALDLALRVGTPADQTRAAVNLSEMLDVAGRLDEAVAEIRAARAAIGEVAEPASDDAFLALQEAHHLLRLGRTAEAEATVPDRIPPGSIGVTPMFEHELRARIALLRGDDAGTRAALDRLRRLCLGTRGPVWLESLELSTTLFAAREGRLDDARAAAERGLAAFEDTDEGGRRTRLLWAALMVEAEAAERASALGEPFDDGPARALAARLERARTQRGQWAEGPLYAALADAEIARLATALSRAAPDGDTSSWLADDRYAPDPASWLAAADGFDELPVPWPAAYARLRAAEVYVAAGDRAAAAGPLLAARSAAEAIEAAPLVEAADALARRARVRIDAPAEEPAEPDAPLGLTPREHDVLLLVAEGRTNREIGAALYMSEKTASVHVSRILAKLDVGGRVEAAAVAHRLGMV